MKHLIKSEIQTKSAAWGIAFFLTLICFAYSLTQIMTHAEKTPIFYFESLNFINSASILAVINCVFFLFATNLFYKLYQIDENPTGILLLKITLLFAFVVTAIFQNSLFANIGLYYQYLALPFQFVAIGFTHYELKDYH